MQFENAVLLDEVHLSLLATTVQSDSCADALIDSTLLKVLSQALTEFCLKLLQQRIDESGASHSATHSGQIIFPHCGGRRVDNMIAYMDNTNNLYKVLLNHCHLAIRARGWLSGRALGSQP